MPPVLTIPEFECFAPGTELPHMVRVAVSDFSGLGDGHLKLSIEGPSGTFDKKVHAGGDYWLPLDGVGDYTVKIAKGETVYDSGAFSIEWCDTPVIVPPTLTVPEFGCFPAAEGLPEQVMVAVSDFDLGGEVAPALLTATEHVGVALALTISGPGGVHSVPVTAGGKYSLPLAGAGTYTVTIADGEWVFDTAEFGVEHCSTPVPPTPASVIAPPVVVTPPPAAPPVLAVTGSGESAATGALAAVAFLTLTSAAVLLSARRRHTG